MQKIGILLVISMLLLGVFMFGENTYPQVSEYGPAILDWGTNVTYGGVVKTVQNWGPLTQNFNPFLPGMSMQSGVLYQIYEPLFYINPLNGDTTGFLGTSYKWEDNDLTLVITTRSGVEWSDGVPFTANDVAFTFNYMKEYPALDSAGIWADSGLQSVEASGTDTVIFKFSRMNTALFPFIAGTLIAPQHIWQNVKDPTHYANINPVGTGPFLLKSFTTFDVKLVKNPNYWMKGRPYIDGMEFISVSSNDADFMYMLNHTADDSYLPIVSPQTAWIAKNPQLNHMYWPIDSVNILYLNTLKYPFNIPTFRKAISLAIDKSLLEKSAYFGAGGYNPNPAAIIPSQLNEWFDPTLTSLASELNTYDPNKAQELLASIGFKKDSSGQLLTPDGKPLPIFKILVGAGWTDYITMAQIISRDLEVLGIKTTLDQEPFGAWASSFTSGTYDIAIDATIPGPTPYYGVYYPQFYPAFSASKIGESAISDYSRYTNPLMTAALNVYSSTADHRLQKQAIYAMERIMLEDIPFIVLTNRTCFFDYTTIRFVGWPTDSNMYANGEGIYGSDGLPISLNLHLK
ncbi:MAG: ABC transporter substrate-binding protein [Candidatus Micrarchaeaceae archaeon]